MDGEEEEDGLTAWKTRQNSKKEMSGESKGVIG